MTALITTFETIECCSCGIVFGVSATFEKALREKHQGFYCPNGHSLVFNAKTAEEKLREQLDAEKARTQFHQEESERRARQLAATKGEVTKLKNRAKAGACPCCQRSFVQLARHMKTQHPEFGASS